MVPHKKIVPGNGLIDMYGAEAWTLNKKLVWSTYRSEIYSTIGNQWKFLTWITMEWGRAQKCLSKELYLVELHIANWSCLLRSHVRTSAKILARWPNGMDRAVAATASTVGRGSQCVQKVCLWCRLRSSTDCVIWHFALRLLHMQFLLLYLIRWLNL